MTGLLDRRKSPGAYFLAALSFSRAITRRMSDPIRTASPRRASVVEACGYRIGVVVGQIAAMAPSPATKLDTCAVTFLVFMWLLRFMLHGYIHSMGDVQ
jgi:hypothetical protein